MKRESIKRALYSCGALAAWHRWRNRERLTVVSFHRVLPRHDPRWATSDPEYTLSLELFAECIAFFKTHYNVISLGDLLDERPLRPRPLLITFDDGWADNEEYALPVLRDHGLPAVIFVVSDIVDRKQPFWQEQMIAAWRGGRLDAEACAPVWARLDTRAPAATSSADLEPVRALIRALERVDLAQREALVASLASRLEDGLRHMITHDQLHRLAASRFVIGAHGKTHTPLTQARDLDSELVVSRKHLEARLEGREVATLACPHGPWDEQVLARARAAGYRRIFTSVPELPSPKSDVLGRVGFTEETITRGDGQLAPELLALHLFRKPHAAPAARRKIR